MKQTNNNKLILNDMATPQLHVIKYYLKEINRIILTLNEEENIQHDVNH